VADASAVLQTTDSGLYCPAGDFFIDPWRPVPRALVTHAHADHAREGSEGYLCAEPSVPLLRRRFADGAPIQGLPYGERLRLGSATVSFHPSGHLLGAAQVRVETDEGVWVFSGDYKRAADPTCAPFEVVRCDTFITEATFALPLYRWEPPEVTVREVLAWWDANREAGRASILFCYTLGKAQRLLAELARLTDRTVFVHGALDAMVACYREAGVRMLPTARVVDVPKGSSFAGELVLAPLSARGTVWMRRLQPFQQAFASGWMQLRGPRRQRNFDRGFPLSDHADWPALLDTVAETGAERVLVTHGFAEPLARHLREDRGLDARVLRTPFVGEAED